MKNPTRKLSRSLALLLLLSLLLAACGQQSKPAPQNQQTTPQTATVQPQAPKEESTQPVPGVTKDEILIGTWVPKSGPAAAFAALVMGMEAKFKAVNDTGGIYGRKLRLVSYDDQYNPAVTVSVVKKMVEEDKVFAFVAGVGNANNMAVKDYINEKGIPHIGPGTGISALVEPPTKQIFATTPTVKLEAQVLVRHAVQDMKAKKIAFFFAEGPIAEDGIPAVKQAMAKFPDVKVAAEIVYGLRDTDFNSHALKLKQADPDVVIAFSLPPATAALLKESAKIGFRPKWVVDMHSNLGVMFQLAGPAWHGVHAANYHPLLTDESKANMKQFKAAMAKYFPDAKDLSAPLSGWYHSEVLVEALNRAGAGLTREKLVQALESLKDWDGGLAHKVTFGPGDRQGQNAFYVTEAQSDGTYKVITDWMEP